MVARCCFLFEASFVLLIDHNQPETPGRGENGTAGADYGLDLALGHSPPLNTTFGVAQMTVEHGDGAATSLEALDRLRCQADLRHQNDGFLPLPHHLLNRAQV